MSDTTSAPRGRREVYYSGRVQGVGFRYTVREIASGRPVTGYVQNLFDGRVLLVAEGTSQALDAFLGSVRGAMERNIEGVETQTRGASGEFEGFEIRR